MRAMDRRVQRVERVQPGVVTMADILASPAWWELRGTIVTALRPYPEARAAVVEALQALKADEPEPSRGRRR